MRPRRLNPKSGCPVELTVSLISGIWKPILLFHILTRKRRFMELSRLIPTATQRMLTLQLRELEVDGLVIRHVYPEVPPRVEYEATALARTLVPLLYGLREWGERYQVAQGESEGDGARCEDAASPGLAETQQA
ncbi:MULTISPECIES: winged helix-turn-helix transcriptional regulator [Pseudoxanthomonas]|jgi:DNA-binding HxlR family transcriptional regulator|uniref:Transcriptional regulator n=1 Tax=Pseudoxanthomonas winnipegensis TaxID=2480810 RepID=A0A4Q8LCN1_9GAMM|nr:MULTISPECIES: helix-turn-helix domain-containing protein [Pseudoxanthomonas]PZP61648.1 MAG: transcriptional regulator [Pseudoxanthomonas spadix]TAA26638.1 transcriptional regulator [Pseudoxanthomonas winnipegensis]TMN24450.1 helix-turn-helix transcriptional regulator [Pseudoxanthomonas sp. X-1]UAY75283.1 helix-turn-helix transcriptional regulator [Pseudoxanthomonas sp. X-1]